MKITQKRKQIIALICGIFGCICFGVGDWLMIYGNPAYTGNIYWLTEGVADIAPWRHTFAMALSFPGILLYGTALFSLESSIISEWHRRVYRRLTAFCLTPWLCLHLLYIMILFTYGWMRNNGFAESASQVCEAMFGQFSWLPLVSEVFMIPPFLYWFWLQFSGKTVFPKAMAFTNILIIYGVLYFVKSLLPVSAFKIGFTNGLMSESMIIWFFILLVWITLSIATAKKKR